MHTLRVIFALGPFAVSFLRDFHRWIWWGARVPRSPEFHARRARRLVETIIRLGPTFVKMAQVFAARADIIPEPYLRELGKLVDQVPPMPYEHVARTIREAYGKDVGEVFLEFERVPIAAASLGQVHCGRVAGVGYRVAVKILRPGVEPRVAADLRAAKRILTWVEARWTHPEIARIRSVLSEFEVRIGEELDFRLEAAYATEIGQNFEGNANVIVPKIVHDLTRQRVLVMEFVEGTRIDKLDRAHIDIDRTVATLVELYVQMSFIDGLFHADPHPGNLMVSPDGRIVLVDFGMTVRVSLETRRALLRTSVAAIRRDAEGVANGFDELGLIAPGTDPAMVKWLAQLLITNAYSRLTLRDRIDSLLADRVMKTLFDFPVVLPQHLVYFGRTAALLEGVGARYDPYFQIIPVASPVIMRMRSRILKSLGETVEPQLEDLVTAAGYALGRAARWVADRVPSDWSRGTRIPLLIVALVGAANCARATRVPPASPQPAPEAAAIVASCDGCAPGQMGDADRRALEERLASLRARGGECAAYGSVLERSYTAGLITIKPYMWRQGARLTSGEARPSGEMTLARDIDSLNVGLRTQSEMFWSMEHEAVHIAFDIPSGSEAAEWRVDSVVRGCRAPAPSVTARQH